MEGKKNYSGLIETAKTRITFFDLERSRSKKLFPVFALETISRTEKSKNQIVKKNLKKYFCGLKNREYNKVQVLHIFFQELKIAGSTIDVNIQNRVHGV